MSLKHTKAVFYMVRRLAKVYGLDSDQLDIALASAILHDIGKPLEIKNGGSSPFKHDVLGARIILHAKPPQSASKGKIWIAISIAGVVERHMGIWGTSSVAIENMSDVEQVVHLADYMAAQNKIVFEDIDSINS